MTPRNGANVHSSAAVIVFVVSAILGLLLVGVVVISDLEGATFDPAIRGAATLTSLRCPVLISSSESGTVSAVVENPLDRQVQYLVRVHVSQGYVTLFRQIDYRVPLGPREKQTLEWEVTADDAAYGWLALVKVWHSASYPQPSRSASCGIPVLPIPLLTGDQFFALLFATSVLGMGLGIGLWKEAGRRSGVERTHVSSAMFFLATALAVNTLVGMTGAWLPGVVLLAGSVLLVAALVFYFLFKVE